MTRALIMVSIGLATLLGAAGRAQAADKYMKAHGLTIVAWSAKVGEDRFRSPRSFEDTVRFYDKLFRSTRSVKQYREVTLPEVKYVHFHNNDKSSEWEGFNIYQEGDKGEVRIYVLKRDMPAAADAKPAEK